LAGQKQGASGKGEKSRLNRPSNCKHSGEPSGGRYCAGQSFKKYFGQENVPRHCVLGGGLLKRNAEGSYMQLQTDIARKNGAKFYETFERNAKLSRHWGYRWPNAYTERAAKTLRPFAITAMVLVSPRQEVYAGSTIHNHPFANTPDRSSAAGISPPQPNPPSGSTSAISMPFERLSGGKGEPGLGLRNIRDGRSRRSSARIYSPHPDQPCLRRRLQ